MRKGAEATVWVVPPVSPRSTSRYSPVFIAVVFRLLVVLKACPRLSVGLLGEGLRDGAVVHADDEQIQVQGGEIDVSDVGDLIGERGGLAAIDYGRRRA